MHFPFPKAEQPTLPFPGHLQCSQFAMPHHIDITDTSLHLFQGDFTYMGHLVAVHVSHVCDGLNSQGPPLNHKPIFFIASLSYGLYLEFFKCFHPTFSPCPVEEWGESGSVGIWLLAKVNLPQPFFGFHPTQGIQILTSNFLPCSQMLLAQVNPAQLKHAPFKTLLRAGEALAQSKGQACLR